MSNEQDAIRGAQAQSILESEVFKDSAAKVQQGIFDAFAATDPKDTAGLVEQRLRLKCLADVLRELTTVMQTGRLARAQMEQEQTLREKVTTTARRVVRAVF